MGNRNQWLKELGCNEQLWAKELEDIPSMIKLSYVQLYELAQDGQVYGVMLQCKDLYEILYKIPIIMLLIIIDSDAKYKEGTAYTEILKAFLGSPMSMGQWDALATLIIKKNKELHLPDGLINILKRTRKLYATEVTSEVPDVINWRNDAIGHGALKFEDDESYKQEVTALIAMLKEYFEGDGRYSVKGLYVSSYFESQGEKLVGDNVFMPHEDSGFNLVVDSVKYEAENYVNSHNLKCFLFDSYYCRKNLIKYSSYIDGKSELLKNKYFADLYEKHVLKPGKTFNLQSEFISREEDMILEYLNMPIAYIKPVHLVEQLLETMDEIEHGIIAVFMERGTGKSAFSNQMSGLYHKNPLIKNSLSRCYHVQNASLRGIGDFFNSVNFSFRHSFDSAQDLWGSSDEMPLLSNDSKTPAEDMAVFLNYYHEKYRKEYTILVLDGIDEVTEQTQRILDYLPVSDQLDDGVFVIILSRFKNEDTVLGNSKKYIEFTEGISEKQIFVNRKDKENVGMLKSCIYQQIKAGKYHENVDCDDLIKKADYRFLFLKAYLEINSETVLDNKNEYHFIGSYFNYILSFYAPAQKHKLKEIAVTIALFPSISIRKYREYMNCDITYEFIGLLNDLFPVMTVLHVNGEDIYAFADAAYAELVLKEFSDVTNEIIDAFYESMQNNLDAYLKNGFLIRMMNELKTESEDKVNNSIVFFSEGIIGLWNRSINNKLVRDRFFSKFYGLILCGNLYMDSWARTGYGLYIRKELTNCMGAALYYCLQNNNDIVANSWSNKICQELKKSDGGTLNAFGSLKNTLVQSKDFSSIFDYIINNSGVLRLEDWYWVLETKITEDVIKILSSQGSLMDSFIDYLSKGNGFNKHKWLNKLSEIELKPEQEEFLLNIQLKHFISGNGTHNGKAYSDCAKECLEKIRGRGYKIDETLIAGDVDEILQHIDSGDLKKEQFKRKKVQAIRILLDFDTPWQHDDDKTNPVFDAYMGVELWNNQELIDNKDIRELHAAFYKRLCFEYDNGRLASFVEAEILLDDFIVNILKNEFGYEEDFYKGLKKWIVIVKGIISKDNKRAIQLLSVMMIEGVNWLTSHTRNEEAEAMLEEYIYNVDTQAFFASYFGRGIISTAIEPDIIYNGEPMVYCTQNAIYLLEYYLTNGMNEKFELLMSKIEKDTPLIDMNHTSNRETQSLCEIRAFRFMKYRQSIGYHSEFDEYLKGLIDAHFSIIDNSLHMLSRNSDFNNIAFHIELLMESAWQVQDWSAGTDMSSNLISIFETHENYDDLVVKQSLDRQVKILRQCQQFFLFLSNDNYSNIEKSDYIFMSGEYHLLGTKTLYETVSRFWRLPVQKRNPEKYIHNDCIVLEVYR